MVILTVCITVLCLSSMLRDKLCSLHITSGHTVPRLRTEVVAEQREFSLCCFSFKC
ncbi:Hok/Gef family protein [Providencia manganoxydans]|nr:Hok/Gef family protein [Providencia manganoxydans]MDX4946819.1 Hok/Gef family protein [Providencia manganoxydans]